MSDLTLLNRAAHIIAQVTPDYPADAALRDELRALALESEEKREISQAVFTYFRWLPWLETGASVQNRVTSALDLQRKFDAQPGFVKPETLAARAVPDWLLAEWPTEGASLLAPARDEDEFAPPVRPSITPYLRSLQRPPTLWIRAQREFFTSLRRALSPCTPADLAGFKAPLNKLDLTALRYTGTQDLFRTSEFKQGLFEIQDLASQLVGHACAPQPGETWWDTCAGEGGKTLHLADLMQNKGLIWASDVHSGRLATLRKRAARARVFNYRTVLWHGGPVLPTKTKFDGVLIDAPCSGVGTWQRNPHARWSTSAGDVRELAEIQQQLLQHAAPSVKPGGRLIYAVCTITHRETAAIAHAFGEAHPDFEPITILGQGPQVYLWPHELNANGMFIAGWKKK